MKISLCIPMYNEERNVDKALSTLSSYMDKNFGEDYEIIFINDGSRDSCAERVKEYIEKENGKIRLIDCKVNMGKGHAVRQGVLASEGDIVMFTDCDLAYGTDVIKRFYDEMKES